MNRDLLIAEFLDAITERAERTHKGKLHHAFVEWYVEAAFGRSADWQWIDDAGDGGIDAIVWQLDDSPPVVLIQSKFTQRIAAAQLPRHEYQAFNEVYRVFRHDKAGFPAFLEKVRTDARRPYKRAFQLLEQTHHAHVDKAFRLITMCRRRASAEGRGSPREMYIYADEILELYEQYRKGATPRAKDLELAVDTVLPYGHPTRGGKAHLFNARVRDFVSYLTDHDVARVVARNIRYDLAGRVGRDIRDTYEKRPDEFWYLHNGITIVCDSFRKRGGRALLENPSVINGAQTLYAIHGSATTRSSALVTVRAIERSDRASVAPEDDDWLQRIIRGVNTQNRVRAFDFRANDPQQIELHERFREVGVFYERKRGEWKELRNAPRYRSFDRITLPRLGQILAAVSKENGAGVVTVKRGTEAVFASDKIYRELFADRRSIGRRFKSMYVAYRLYRLLQRKGFVDARRRRRRKQAFLSALWLLYMAIESRLGSFADVNVRGLRERFDDLEGDGAIGRRAGAALKRITAEVWTAWRAYRRRDPEQWTAANFFKSQVAHRALRARVLPKVKAHARVIADALG